jgi:MFS family permease
MRRSRVSDPLKRPQFRRLATSYAVNQLGDWMGIVALSVLVFDRTGSAMATAALFIGTRFLPALLAPILVVRIEHPPPRFALPLIYCGEAAAFGGLALFAGNDFALAAVIALAAIDGTLALAGRALTRAVVTALLEPAGELRAGNSVLNVAFTAGAAIGPAVAGLVVAGFGAQTALLLDAVSFYAVAWILLTGGPLPQAEPDPGLVRERIRAGMEYIRRETTLRRLLIAQGTALAFFSAAIPVEIVYAEQTLGASASGYGLLLTSWGTGMVLGGVVFAAARRASLATLFFASTAVVGIGYIGLAAAPTLAVACITALVGGTGNGVQWVTAVSAIQELTTSSMQDRVMSVLESIGAAMPAVGFLLGGLLATGTTARLTLLVAGLGALATMAVSALALGRNWPDSSEKGSQPTLNADPEIMVELIPAGGRRPLARSNSEVVS